MFWSSTSAEDGKRRNRKIYPRKVGGRGKPIFWIRGTGPDAKTRIGRFSSGSATSNDPDVVTNSTPDSRAGAQLLRGALACARLWTTLFELVTVRFLLRLAMLPRASLATRPPLANHRLTRWPLVLAAESPFSFDAGRQTAAHIPRPCTRRSHRAARSLPESSREQRDLRRARSATV